MRRKDGADDEYDNTNVFLYSCRCGKHFVIEGTKIKRLKTHRTSCNLKVQHDDIIPEDIQEVHLKYNIKPRWKFSRTDDYEKVATLFKKEDDKIIIRGFHVYVGTIDKIKEWIYDDKFYLGDLKYILDKDLKQYFENHVFEKPKKLDNDTILTTETNKSRKKVVKRSPPKVSPPKVSPPLATTKKTSAKKTSPKKTSPKNFRELIEQAKRNDNFIDLTI